MRETLQRGKLLTFFVEYFQCPSVLKIGPESLKPWRSKGGSSVKLIFGLDGRSGFAFLYCALSFPDWHLVVDYCEVFGWQRAPPRNTRRYCCSSKTQIAQCTILHDAVDGVFQAKLVAEGETAGPHANLRGKTGDSVPELQKAARKRNSTIFGHGRRKGM